MGFKIESIRSGLIHDESKQIYPSRLWGHIDKISEFSCEYSTYFGYCHSGKAELQWKDGNLYTITEKMYFCCPKQFLLNGKAEVSVFERIGFKGIFSLGGPTEPNGRLSYIDNCTTTLLCPPPRDGDPCFNLLVFPENTKQSTHIHPTIRLGAVIAGSGECILGQDKQKVALSPGSIFVIEAGTLHCFHSGPKGLAVVAYHPDSEGGPTDKSHPMLNRTYIQG